MRLLTLHKILIGFAITFFLFFGFREIFRENGSSVMGFMVLALAVGAGFYLVWVLKGGYD